MPGKKRTDQTKHTPPASPTASTSHASADQHRRHRHIISTRSAVPSSKPPPVSPHPEPTFESHPTHEGVREKKPLATTSPPGARTLLTKFLYLLLFFVLLLFGWYIYGMVTLLERLKEEVGWWGIITGDTGGPRVRWESGSDWSGGQGGRVESESGGGGGLEDALDALADVLGISPVQIASAVKPLVPQASLTSMAPTSGTTGSSEAVRILFEDTMRNDRDAAGIVEEIAEKLGRGTAEGNVGGGGLV